MTHTLTPTPAPKSSSHPTRKRIWTPALAAGLLVLLAAAPVFAALPVAVDATVWAVPRYEVETSGGELEYQIPIDLLAFASDADGNPLTFSVTQPPVGTVTPLGAGLVRFRIGVAELAAERAGVRFDFTVSDGTGGSATATVLVDEPNILLPKSEPDFFDVPVDQASTLPVLDNDEGFDSITAFTQGTRGDVVLDATGTALIFTPAADFAPGETDTFTYTPAGPSGDGEPTQVTVTGLAPPDPVDPVLQVLQNWDNAPVPEGATVPFLEPVALDQPDSLRFNLHNPTEEIVEITNAASAVSGECFSVPVGEPVPSTVPPASTLAEGELPPGFRVRVQCPTSGLKTGTVTLETQSASGTPYRAFTFTVTAEVIAGPTPLVVRQGWDGAVIPDGGHFVFPGDVIFWYPNTFAIELHNPTGQAIDIRNAADAITGVIYRPTQDNPVPASVGPGETRIFEVLLDIDEEGTFPGSVILDTASSSGELYESYSFSFEATQVIPAIGVYPGWLGEGAAAIQDGQEVALPTIAAAGDPFHSAGFNIRNTGTAGTLAIQNPDATLVSGNCFEVRSGGYPDELVPVGGQTAFRVWWGGSCGPGTYTATVIVKSNAVTDWDNPFLSDNRVTFTVVGEVAAVPELTCEPADARVVSGDTVSFDVCVSNDDGTFTYAWFKDGQAIPGAGPTLTLTGVTDADEGAYHVEVTGELGPVSSRAATLTVVNQPVVSQPADQTVSVGGTATFSVTVSSPVEDGPFTYVWQELPPGAATFQTITGATTDTLTVTGVTTAMDGTFYRCLVSNEAGQTNPGRGKLTVVDPPVITQQPQSQRVVAGSNVSFSVTATGLPSPEYLWKKDGVSLGVTTSTLSLTAVTDADEGNYRVTVSNSEGSVTSQIATLTVVEKPVVSRPAHQSAPIGGSATFSVTVSSPAEDGPFTYRWQELAPGAAKFQTITGATSPSLTVSNVTAAMDGTRYRCLVSNDAGQSNSKYGLLTVLTPDVQVTGVWDGGAIGEGAIVDFGTVERGVATSRRFQISNIGQATLTLSNPTSFVSGSCWSQIESAASSVAPGASTYFRVRIFCNSTGTKTGTVTIQSNDPSSPFSFQVRGTVVASDVLVTQNWDGATVGAGTTQFFGSVETGVATSKRYVITNTGQATLTISNPTSLVSGTCWSQIENAVSTVAPGASTYFRVRLLCSSTGTKTGTVTIHSNDPSSPYQFNVQGTVNPPPPGDVTVYRAWNGVVQGENTTFPFPDTLQGTSESRRFRITNTGSGTLTISNPTSLVSGTCWSQIENAASSVAPGASTYFRVRLLCNTTGTKTGTITIYSNDTSSPYRFYVQGTVTAPEPGNVTVYRAWNGVVQGEGTTFPFPDTTTGSAVSRRFQITNTGSGTLTISNPTSFVSGSCWSQIENAASSVAPGASTYFRVRLLCSSTGTKTGTITIYSNDTSSPYRFYVQGTVN